jgi:hypothetical protein
MPEQAAQGPLGKANPIVFLINHLPHFDVADEGEYFFFQLKAVA